MRWISSRDRAVKKILEQKNWHEWFAWYPVQLSSDGQFKETVWLEKVYRRRVWSPHAQHRSDDIYYAENLVRNYFSWQSPRRRFEYKELTQLIIDESEKKS